MDQCFGLDSCGSIESRQKKKLTIDFIMDQCFGLDSCGSIESRQKKKLSQKENAFLQYGFSSS